MKSPIARSLSQKVCGIGTLHSSPSSRAPHALYVDEINSRGTVDNKFARSSQTAKIRTSEGISDDFRESQHEISDCALFISKSVRHRHSLLFTIITCSTCSLR